MGRRTLIAGNWKMHGRQADIAWIGQLMGAVSGRGAEVDVLLCPPATLIIPFAPALASAGLLCGAQDCAVDPEGAHTGDISAAMLKDAGARFVITGHSERRADHAEDDACVRAKCEAALSAGLTPILCVGESLADREAGRAEQVVIAQLLASLPRRVSARELILAYEPVWAIGTGQTATAADAQTMHAALRAAWPGTDADDLQILYGGSVKPENAAALLAERDIDGALVGGASLDPAQFANIINAAG